jgi:hypothetical protein
MKKIIKCMIIFFTLTGINNPLQSLSSRSKNIPATPRSIITQERKNDAQAAQLAQEMKQTTENLDKATSKAERERLKKQLQEQFEKSVSFIDRTQNLFFGTGKIADQKRQQAEKRRPTLVQKLNKEVQHYRQLVKNPVSKQNETLKQKSLERQAIIRQKIKIEDIALGKAWSTKQYVLAAGATAAAAALGLPYAAPFLAKGYGMYIAASNPITANMSWSGAAGATALGLGLKAASANIQGRAIRKIMQTIYPTQATAPLRLILTQQFNPEEMNILGFFNKDLIIDKQKLNVWLTSTGKLIINPDETPYQAAQLPIHGADDEPDTD